MKKLTILLCLFASMLLSNDNFTGWNIITNNVYNSDGIIITWFVVENQYKRDIVVSKVELPGRTLTIVGDDINNCSEYFTDHKNIKGILEQTGLSKDVVKIYYDPELAYIFHYAQIKAKRAYGKNDLGLK